MKKVNVWAFALIFVTGISVVSCGRKTSTQEKSSVHMDRTNNEYLQAWQQGYLDIHQISTGRGNAAFFMMPDGTTLLLDAGDLGDETRLKQEIMPQVPNATKRPAEWIATYIKHFAKPLDRQGYLDYVVLTHFDADHIGCPDTTAIETADRPYKLTGITHVAELLQIGTLIDRGWPDYNYPSRERILAQNKANFNNYLTYANDRHQKGLPVEKFQVGSNRQIRLKHAPDAYRNFEIRNVYSNGVIWTGIDDGVKNLAPDLATLAPNQHPDENRCSNAIKLQYGAFDYFSGGDINGKTKDPVWFDIETPVGLLVGPMDVVVANHHAYLDAMNENFIKATCPQVFIIPVWDFYHPEHDPLRRMLDKQLYPEDRMVFSAGIVKNNITRLGENGRQIMPDGHIVVRVYPNGDTFQVFVLDNESTDYNVIYKSEVLKSK